MGGVSEVLRGSSSVAAGRSGGPVQHLDAASEVDRVVTDSLVEPSQERDLRADGCGHRPGGNLTRQPIVQDVDLLVVFG